MRPHSNPQIENMPKIQNTGKGKTSKENFVENMGTVVKKYDDLKRCTVILTEGIETGNFFSPDATI